MTLISRGGPEVTVAKRDATRPIAEEEDPMIPAAQSDLVMPTVAADARNDTVVSFGKNDPNLPQGNGYVIERLKSMY